MLCMVKTFWQVWQPTTIICGATFVVPPFWCPCFKLLMMSALRLSKIHPRATPADLLANCMAAEPFWSTYLHTCTWEIVLFLYHFDPLFRHICPIWENHLFSSAVAVQSNNIKGIKLSQLKLMKIHTWPFCSELRPYNYYVPIYVLTYYDMDMDSKFIAIENVMK